VADRAQPGASAVPTRRALVVDDSRAARVAAARLVEPWGFDVDLAEDGAAALRRLEEQAAYDLVLLDLRMPALDGHECLRILRARANFTPVVIMTAGMDTKLVAATLRLGATDFLVKPLEPGPVRQALARALGLEPEALHAETPRVLLAGREDCAAELRAALPGHVEIDRVDRPALDQGLTQGSYRLVVVDLRRAPVSAEAAAALSAAVHGAQPGAAICAVTSPGVPNPGLDASVPLHELGALASGSLYPNAVRPLVLPGVDALVVTGFRADLETQPLYFAIAGRRLRAAVEPLAAAGKERLTVDLTRVPARAAGVERLAATAVEAVAGRVEEVVLRVAPAFQASVARLGLAATVEAPDHRTGPRGVFRWTADLAVGVEAIDRQHRELFERVNALLLAVGGRAEQEVARAIRFLEQYTEEHFADEEALMASVACPESGEHRAQHRTFRSKLEVLAQEFSRSGFTAELRQRLERDVCEWLWLHVRKTDRALGQLLSRPGTGDGER
jgi:hemerythrin